MTGCLRMRRLDGSVRCLLIIPLLMAGCFAPCPPLPVAVTWEDPALFAAIEGEARPAATGLAVVGVWLVELDHRVPIAEGGNFRLTDRGITQQIRSGESDAEVEAGLRRFLENITTTFDEDYVASFMASREVAGEGVGPAGRTQAVVFHGPVPDRLRLDALYEETVGGMQPARRMEAGGWSWHLAYPTKSVTLGPGDLTVDAVGVAAFEHTWPKHTSQEQMEADVRLWLAEAGFPAPASMEIHEVYCD